MDGLLWDKLKCSKRNLHNQLADNPLDVYFGIVCYVVCFAMGWIDMVEICQIFGLILQEESA